MNDSFYEQLVARKARTTDTLIKTALIALIAILLISTLFIGMVMILAAIVAAVIAGLLIFPKLNVEYEYTLLNHDMSIDVIYSQAKRKQLMTIDLKEAEVIAPKTSHELDSYHDYKIYDYSAGDPDQTPYAVMIPQSQQMSCILIQPDQKMLDHMAMFLPRILHRD